MIYSILFKGQLFTILGIPEHSTYMQFGQYISYCAVMTLSGVYLGLVKGGVFRIAECRLRYNYVV